MSFGLSNIFTTLNTYSPLLQVVVLVVALAYAGWQTRQLSRQIRLNMVTSTALHLKDVNQLIVEHPAVAKIVNDTSTSERGEAAFADIVLGTFEIWYDLYKQKLIKEGEWKERYLPTVRKVLKTPAMHDHWKVNESDYWKGFREYIDTQVFEVASSLITTAQVNQKGGNA